MIDMFTITGKWKDSFLCTSHGDIQNETEILTPFLWAHGLSVRDTFVCEVDESGSIILETIRKV